MYCGAVQLEKELVIMLLLLCGMFCFLRNFAFCAISKVSFNKTDQRSMMDISGIFQPYFDRQAVLSVFDA